MRTVIVGGRCWASLCSPPPRRKTRSALSWLKREARLAAAAPAMTGRAVSAELGLSRGAPRIRRGCSSHLGAGARAPGGQPPAGQPSSRERWWPALSYGSSPAALSSAVTPPFQEKKRRRMHGRRGKRPAPVRLWFVLISPRARHSIRAPARYRACSAGSTRLEKHNSHRG